MLDTDKDVLLEVWMPSCRSCAALNPRIKMLASLLAPVPSVRIATLNCEDNDNPPEVPEDGTPVLKLFPGADKASATCVMNFDEATGFMIGEENKGLECMFTFMNSARIGTACQGIAHAELAYQGSLPYAKERRSMRALSGKKDPDAVADALIHHGDVRRMLLKQKAIAEGGRAMIYFAAQYADNMISGMLEDDQEKYDRWDSELGFLTPILKGFLTEKGLEVANGAMQILEEIGIEFLNE